MPAKRVSRRVVFVSTRRDSAHCDRDIFFLSSLDFFCIAPRAATGRQLKNPRIIINKSPGTYLNMYNADKCLLLLPVKAICYR